MASIFLDSLAVVRRYFQPEPGANRVREVCAPSLQHTLLLARLAPVEVAAALSRRVREGTLTRHGRDARLRAFRADWDNQYAVVRADDAVHDRAEQLVVRHPLHSLDAIQLACALAEATHSSRQRLQFWTADRQQASAAQAEGLHVELLI